MYPYGQQYNYGSQGTAPAAGAHQQPYYDPATQQYSHQAAPQYTGTYYQQPVQGVMPAAVGGVPPPEVVAHSPVPYSVPAPVAAPSSQTSSTISSAPQPYYAGTPSASAADTQQMDITIRKDNGQVPTFEEYLDYKKMLSRKDLKRRFGKNPTFREYIEFYDRKDSINWMKVCGMVPAFEDYLEFVRLRDGCDWLTTCQVVPTFKDYIDHIKKNESYDFKAECGIRPRFKDYLMYYKVIKKAKDWAAVYNRPVTYVDYLSFTREVEERNWKEYAPLTGEPRFEDYLNYSKECDSRAWEKDYGANPSFAEYVQIKELQHEKHEFRFRGMKPKLAHLMEFKEHKKSRDWIGFCEKMPTLEDYVAYQCHQDTRPWKMLATKYNDKPYFTDYMKFLQIRASKDWISLRGNEPTFLNFIEYLCRRQSKDWKFLLGQVPSFAEFIEYVDHSASPEWKALGDDMPSFLAFMGYKFGITIKEKTTVRDEAHEFELPQEDDSRKHSRNKRSRSSSSDYYSKRVRDGGGSRERSRDRQSRLHRSRSRSGSRPRRSRSPMRMDRNQHGMSLNEPLYGSQQFHSNQSIAVNREFTPNQPFPDNIHFPGASSHGGGQCDMKFAHHDHLSVHLETTMHRNSSQHPGPSAVTQGPNNPAIPRNAKKLKCSVCEQSFSKAEQLTRHLHHEHRLNLKKSEWAPPYPCRLCDIKPNCWKNLEQHMAGRHNIVTFDQIRRVYDGQIPDKKGSREKVPEPYDPFKPTQEVQRSPQEESDRYREMEDSVQEDSVAQPGYMSDGDIYKSSEATERSIFAKCQFMPRVASHSGGYKYTAASWHAQSQAEVSHQWNYTIQDQPAFVQQPANVYKSYGNQIQLQTLQSFEEVIDSAHIQSLFSKYTPEEQSTGITDVGQIQSALECTLPANPTDSSYTHFTLPGVSGPTRLPLQVLSAPSTQEHSAQNQSYGFTNVSSEAATSRIGTDSSYPLLSDSDSVSEHGTARSTNRISVTTFEEFTEFGAVNKSRINKREEASTSKQNREENRETFAAYKCNLCPDTAPVFHNQVDVHEHSKARHCGIPMKFTLVGNASLKQSNIKIEMDAMELSTKEKTIGTVDELLDAIAKSPYLDWLRGMYGFNACKEALFKRMSKEKRDIMVKMKKNDKTVTELECCGCTKTFGNIFNLNRHSCTEHEFKHYTSVLRCIQCGWDFQASDIDFQNFSAHVKHVHGIDVGRIWHGVSGYRGFFRTHTRPYKALDECAECGFRSCVPDIMALHSCSKAKLAAQIVAAFGTKNPAYAFIDRTFMNTKGSKF